MLSESNLAEVLHAHAQQDRFHTLDAVIEHRALTTHNDTSRHWRGDHSDASYATSIVPRARAALAEYEAARDTYIDVHAWQFTPASFRLIAQSLFEMGLIRLQVERVYNTPHGYNEFTAVLGKLDERPDIASTDDQCVVDGPLP